MARENFSIGAFYNVTKNHDNPIKTIGQDSLLSPKTLKIQVLGVTQPPGVAQPYILGDTTRPGHVTCVLVWSKSDRRRLKKLCTNKQTDKQQNRQYENNGHLAVNQLILAEVMTKKQSGCFFWNTVYLHLQCAHGQPLESNLRRGQSLGGRWCGRTKGRHNTSKIMS